MKLVFVSNYFNHHQRPISEAFHSLNNLEYAFIETTPMREERLKLGWGEIEKPSYVKSNYVNVQEKEACQKLIDEADIVIVGSAPHELFRNRLKNKKITFLYHERIYKKGYEYHKMVFRLIRNYKEYTRYKSLYLLCASAYAASDFAKTLNFINKAYKWGYFPELKQYDDIDALIKNKNKNSILWVARFIDWKHPEIPLQIAKMLKSAGYCFELNMIGNGELLERIKDIAIDEQVDDCVHILGSCNPEEVRENMEKSEIFIFTSDKNEGWGAVLNEAMNSGCATVASHAIGAVPFLVDNGKNGLIYKDGDVEELYRKVCYMLDNPARREEIAKKGYSTICEEWNAQIASKKFIAIAEKLLSGKRNPFPYCEGICSKAEMLNDNWFVNQ